jgi:hypothetical protein
MYLKTPTQSEDTHMNNISPGPFGLTAHGVALQSHAADPELSRTQQAIIRAINKADTVVITGSSARSFGMWIPQPFHPLIGAMFDGGVGLLFVGRDTNPRLIHAADVRGIVALIGDDRRRYRHRIDGPNKYDRSTIVELLGATSLVCAHRGPIADRKYYQTLAQTAATGDIAVAVAVRNPRQEFQWIDFIKHHSPQSRKIFVGVGAWQTRFGAGEESRKRRSCN